MTLRLLPAMLLVVALAAPWKANAAPGAKEAQVFEITVTSRGFEPSVVTAARGKPVKLVVTRTTERTCATEIVMKDFGVNRSLPVGRPVEVVVSPKGPGTYRFACGMDMVAGVLKVQ